MQIRLNRFKDGKPKAMTMSYDDGVRQDIRLVEIFNKYGIKGTFHLNSGNLTDSYDPNSRCLSKAEIANVYKGHEVSMHTSTHPDPLAVSQQCWVNEILKDKRALEQLCGSIVRGISYPFGTVTRQAAETARMLGAEYARTVKNSGGFRIPEDFMYWWTASEAFEAIDTASKSELLARRFLPCTPLHAVSPAENSRFMLVFAFRSTLTPPIK